MSKTASSVVVTDKFKKELENFFEWASVCGYKIKDINDEIHEWSMKLMTKFEEPSRNKLEAYIKGLFAKYTISLNECDIEDAKLLAKEFKEKPKKKSSKKATSDVEVEEKPKKKSSKKATSDVEKPKKKSSKKATSDVELEVEGNIKLDMTLDTSETYNIDTLEFWTEELIQVFGKPKKTGKSGDEHTWEWKIEVNGEPYTIYDWNENGDSFEETTWYLGGMSENKKNIKELNKYIEGFFMEEQEQEQKKQVKKRSKKEKVVEEVEVKEEVEEVEVEVGEVDHKELFGDDDDEIELDLDDIEDE